MQTVADRRRVAARPGFTLLEIVVAIALAAVVTLMTVEIARSVATAGGRLADHAERAGRAANGERLLRRVVGGLDASADDAERFVGGADAFSFVGRCEVASGWQERCHVSVTLARHDAGRALRMVLATSRGDERVELGEVGAVGAFRYLVDAADGGRWTGEWSSRTAVPLGIEVPFGDETLFLRVGERG